MSLQIADKHEVSQISTKDYSTNPAKTIFLNYFTISKVSKFVVRVRESLVKIGCTVADGYRLQALRDALRTFRKADRLTSPML